MQKSRVAIDIDNVLNNLVVVMFEIFEERYGEHINYDDCVNYDFSGLGNQQMIDRLYAMFAEKELWDRLVPPENAQKYLKKLREEYAVWMVTATDSRNFQWKCDWVADRFPWFPQERIVRLHDKYLLSVDYLIDDYSENLKTSSSNRIILTAPWNRAERDEVFGFNRVADLKEAYEVICRIEEEEKEW